MLWLVGMGISGVDSITKSGAKAISNADIIYYEQFTSPAPVKNTAAAIQEITASGRHATIKDAKRWMVEDGTCLLTEAATKNVVLLSYGDPLVATTHAELLCRAAASDIETRVIHASSGPASIVGECGLHHYKMGKMATIMRDEKSMTTPYYTIYKNAIEQCHTLLLLEYDYEGTEKRDGKSFFLEPADALNGLLKIEEGQKRNIITDSTYAIIASRVGLEDRQRITAGKISGLIKRKEFGTPPHSIIIPGKLHFTESDALAALAECIDAPPQFQDCAADEKTTDPNSPVRISEQMVTKYAPMIRRSITKTSTYCKGDKQMEEILENAELYVRDAEDFIKKEGHEDVAVLSIGYADGLVDALRILRGLGTEGKARDD